MLKRVTLIRLESTPHGTFGKLMVDGLTFFTGELPWRENVSNVSSIPSGIYGCKWTMSARFKRGMYLVTGVEGRDGIRFHSANLMGDKGCGFKAQLNGCIALGEKLGTMNGQKALLLSAPAMRKFEVYMNKKSFILEVHDA